MFISDFIEENPSISFSGHLVLGTGTIHELTQFYSTLKRITQRISVKNIKQHSLKMQ